MAKTRRQAVDQPERPRRTVPQSLATKILTRHIDEGRELLLAADEVHDDASWTEWSERFGRWRDVTQTALRKVYTTDEPREEFDRSVSHIYRRVDQSDGETFQHQKDVIGKGVNKLAAFVEGLDYVEGPEEAEVTPAAEPEGKTYSETIFVVHGRDEGLRDQVARVLERLGLEPLILMEEPNRGRTLIEKFEEGALDVGFAVVLLTADDWARGPDDGELPGAPNRARQNVILELGYFMGRLGRARVAALFEPGTEVPSDIHGLGYIQIDAGGAWRFKLGVELGAAGYDVDLNRLK